MARSNLLPTAIGSTENALRALLASVLSVTRIGSYEEWLYLNARASAPSDAGVAEHVASVLKKPLRTVQLTVRDLSSRGLIGADGALTAEATEELARARSLVGSATASVTRDLLPNDVEAALNVLTRVRQRAEELLADS